ncbi:MAG: hypothetical protein AB7K67_14040 [Hyphomicrobiaceae bacterium]|jgi:hypothetical protein
MKVAQMKARVRRAGAVLAVMGGLAGSLAMSSPATAVAQGKDLSDRSVGVLMSYAWAMMPAKFTTPTGKTIEIDKTKRNEIVVGMDTAREAIRVARLSAYAQICDLPEEQRQNYVTLMRREEAKGKWTEQQMLYINQLHLFTVMTLTGKIKLVEKDGDKEVVVKQPNEAENKTTCTDTEKAKVKEQIAAYVNSQPQPAPQAAAPAKQQGKKN